MSIKIKVSMTCAYKEYGVKMKLWLKDKNLEMVSQLGGIFPGWSMIKSLASGVGTPPPHTPPQ